MSDVVYARTGMWVSPGTYLEQNKLYATDHPLVLEHPDWFSADLLQIAERAPDWRDRDPLEQPVKRGPGRPRKYETTDREREIEVDA